MSDSSNNLGSFCVPRKAVEVLIDSRATALQIGAYLTLSRYTNKDNRFSTASLKAIYNTTGASNMRGSTGERIVNELCKMRPPSSGIPKEGKPFLLYRADEWTRATDEAMPEIPHDLYSVRYVLNDFGDEHKVWFPNSLVDGIGKFKQPLKTLKHAGDVAGRLLLLMYAHDNMVEFGGVPPYRNFYSCYETSHRTTTHSCSFWQAKHISKLSFNSLSCPALGLKELPTNSKEKQIALRPFWDALESMDSLGFINEIVTVLDGSPDEPDSRPVFILHTKERHGHADKSLDLATPVDLIAGVITGEKAADSLGRFNGSYSIIVPAGIKPHVVGIYRLRFRIGNQRNHGIGTAWGRMREDCNTQLEVLQGLCERATINSDDVLPNNAEHAK